MTNNDKLGFEHTTPKIFSAVLKTQATIDAAGLDRKIHHLCVLRASQINGCAFCVAMHIKDARADGESQDRLDQLVVWRETTLFSAKEKAAFSWVEALTNLEQKSDLTREHQTLSEHFTEEEICVLTADIAMINLWNRLNVARHAVN